MEDFINFFDEIKEEKELSINIYNSASLKWCINIGYKFPHPKHGSKIIDVEEMDQKLAFAMAYVELKRWVNNN